LQRVDKYLWFSRCYKSRTLAASMVADGRVRINGVRCAKPSTTVKAGDVLTLTAGPHVRVLKVLSGGERRGPASEAQLLYEDLTPAPPPKDALPTKLASRERGAGRPTKKERRDIKAFTDGGEAGGDE
jgi:ribosome-associated heat shock protein Hsp15